MNERMRTGSKYIKSIEIRGEDTAKTEIIYNIKNVRYELFGISLFTNIHNSIYNKLYEDVKRIVEKYRLKFRQFVNFRLRMEIVEKTMKNIMPKMDLFIYMIMIKRIFMLADLLYPVKVLLHH